MESDLTAFGSTADGAGQVQGSRCESPAGQDEALEGFEFPFEDIDMRFELFERYGDVLRPAPRAEGFGLTAYVFPVIAFLAGGVVVVVFLRRQTRAVATPEPSPHPSDPELERVIDQELAG